MINNKFFEMLLCKKTVSMMVLLNKITSFNKKKINCSLLSKKSNCTYSHTCKMLKEMNEANLINFERNGREKNVMLTKKGYKLASFLGSIKRMVK